MVKRIDDWIVGDDMLINEEGLKRSKEISYEIESFLKHHVIQILKKNYPKTDFESMNDEDLSHFILNNNLWVAYDSSEIRYELVDKFTLSIKQTFKDVKVFQTTTRELK